MATTISNGESGSSVRTKLNNIWEGLQINEIASTISDTAVDIFVYDTRKDSDGGAWRKRTQHTSWYNETLNTSTRGSRKEFPAVAVIVAESNQVTIYDGDDPDLPMWMVFDVDGSSGFLLGSIVVSSISALNGQLAVGGADNYDGLYVLDFISEYGINYRASGISREFLGNVADRSSAVYGANNSSLAQIVNHYVNDVAMTVLPNAPIDAATGLPVPTIAVATDGGVSIIKDDGTVFNPVIGSYDQADLAFNEDWSIMSVGRVADRSFKVGLKNDEFAFETLGGNNTQYVGELNIAGETWTTLLQDSTNLKTEVPNFIHGGSLSRLKLDRNNASRSLLNYTTSDYNTGWMNGDIKLATLSDKYNASEPNVTGSELVTNGDFATDSDWTKASGATISGGEAVFTSVASATNAFTQNITLVSGKVYTVSFEITSISAGAIGIFIPTDVGGPVYESSTGSYSVTFTATATSRDLSLRTSGTTTATVDNISVRLAEKDRSVNGNGLQVFGTVTKSAVATGADLVAYSGFSSSNYLEQPYNADLDFGTGDFCIVGWNKGTDTAGYLIARNDGSGSTDRIAVDVFSSKYRFYLEAGATGVLTSTSDATTNTWTQFCALRRSGAIELYINGKLEASGTSTVDLDNSSCVLNIGDVPHVGNAYSGSLALLRISATAPSPEQIKKIYEDEKVLFQEGAQATLYGLSDAVTALAYDDSTELLHVGTSDGRSVFQGLRRVDNTTTAVGAAISASNGLVADE